MENLKTRRSASEKFSPLTSNAVINSGICTTASLTMRPSCENFSTHLLESFSASKWDENERQSWAKEWSKRVESCLRVVDLVMWRRQGQEVDSTRIRWYIRDMFTGHSSSMEIGWWWWWQGQNFVRQSSHVKQKKKSERTWRIVTRRTEEFQSDGIRIDTSPIAIMITFVFFNVEIQQFQFNGLLNKWEDRSSHRR